MNAVTVLCQPNRYRDRGLLSFEGCVWVREYADCYAKLKKTIEIFGDSAADENAICGLLAGNGDAMTF